MAEVSPKQSGQVKYRRVRGLWQIGAFSRASLFTGGDHLLLCDYRTGFTERYKRFYFSDIQAIIIRRTPHWLLGMTIWGFFAIVFLVIALGTRWNLFLQIMEGICLLFVLRHLIRGPSCRTHIQTAVQTDVLPMLKRVRKTNRVLSRIFPLIEQAQGAMTAIPAPTPPPPLEAATPSAGATPSAAAVPAAMAEKAPIMIPHSLSWLHVALFIIVALTGLNAIWEVNYPSSMSLGILTGLFAASVVGGIVAMVRQAKHRVHRGAALMVWLVVITFVVGMGGADYIFTMIDAVTRSRLGMGGPSTFDFLSPFALRTMNGFDVVLWIFGVWSILLGLLGLIFVFLRPPAGIQSPPPPPPLPGVSPS